MSGYGKSSRKKRSRIDTRWDAPPPARANDPQKPGEAVRPTGDTQVPPDAGGASEAPSTPGVDTKLR